MQVTTGRSLLACKKNRGFTLLEIMIVVVIAVTVVAFSVPAYKKAQNRNKFMAAQGVLIELGAAIASFAAEYPGIALPNATLNRGYITDRTTCPNPIREMNLSDASACLPFFLFRDNFMTPIAFDSADSYKGYQYYTCGSGGGSCCAWNNNAVACMDGGAGVAPYQGAWVEKDGTLGFK